MDGFLRGIKKVEMLADDSVVMTVFYSAAWSAEKKGSSTMVALMDDYKDVKKVDRKGAKKVNLVSPWVAKMVGL